MKKLFTIVMIVALSACCKKGDTGAAGIAGTPGHNGTNGTDGSNGINGTNGTNGSNGIDGTNGTNGINGAQGYGAGVQVAHIAASVSCPAGGLSVTNFQDVNNNGLPDPGESIIAVNYVCNGVAGTNGTNGSNGSNGADGSNGTNGTNGTNGSNGSNGTNGVDGISTTFSIVPDSGVNCTNGGFDITFTAGATTSTQYVCNGTNGLNGNSGQAGTNGSNGSNGGTVTFNMVQAIMPCGFSSSPWKEVILGLQGGQLLSSFSETMGGQNTRLSFIPNGSYIDTDSSGCNFSVSGDGSTTSQISWGSGSNAYSSWSAGGYSWTPAAGWVSL